MADENEKDGTRQSAKVQGEEDADNPVVQCNSAKSSLSDAQRAKIERNRQKALLLKQARLTSRPLTSKRKG